MAARTANAVEHVRDDDFGAHVTQRIGPRVQGTDHGTYTMASFRQDGDGRIRGRADAAGGASNEDGFLGQDSLPCVSEKDEEHEQRTSGIASLARLRASTSARTALEART